MTAASSGVQNTIKKLRMMKKYLNEARKKSKESMTPPTSSELVKTEGK